LQFDLLPKIRQIVTVNEARQGTAVIEPHLSGDGRNRVAQPDEYLGCQRRVEVGAVDEQ
jgi:hypothetical protein